MTLDELQKQIRELFEEKKIELLWNIPADVRDRIFGDLRVEEKRILKKISQLTEEQIEESFDDLIQQTMNAIEEIANEESPLDLTTSFEEDESLLILDDVERTIQENINARIFTIIHEAIGEEPTPMLLEAFNPGYLAEEDIDTEVIESILENFADEIDLRNQVNDLISLRENLIEQARNLDDQACMDITATINAIVDDMGVETEERAQRIREILLKLANNNPGALEHAIEIGVNQVDITRLQLAANELAQTKQDDMSNLVQDSIESAPYSPLRIRPLIEEPQTSENILEELYQYIINQSHSSPNTPTVEEETHERNSAGTPIFPGLDTIHLSTEEINNQIHSYLEQVLLGEEGNFDAEIVDYVTGIIGTIDQNDGRLGMAHARIQELMERVSLEYDVFESINGINNENTRRENTPIDQEPENIETDYIPPPPPLARGNSNATWSRESTPEVVHPDYNIAGITPNILDHSL